MVLRLDPFTRTGLATPLVEYRPTSDKCQLVKKERKEKEKSEKDTTLASPYPYFLLLIVIKALL